MPHGDTTSLLAPRHESAFTAETPVIAPERPHVEKSSATELGGRLAAMDALRGGAMILGVFIHAAISYMPSNLADLYWGVREEETSAVIDTLFWWIHAWRLPLFFLIAGFFADLVIRSKGLEGFFSHRAKRLLIPYVVGILIMVPPTYFYAWACGVISEKLSDPDMWVLEISPQVQSQLLGPMHLWFLQDLMILSLAFVVCRWMFGRRQAKDEAVPYSAALLLAAPLILSLPTALILGLEPRPLLAHHNSFLPEPVRLLHYGYFFLIGAWVYRYRHVLRDFFRWPLTHLALSLPAAVIMLILLPAYFDGSLSETGRWGLTSSASVLAWLSVFGFLGLTLHFFHGGPHPFTNYLADSAYWIYLFHLPTVCLVQFALCGAPLPPLVKCGIVIVTTVGLGLATYQTMVRYTFIGTCLHGVRHRQTLAA